MSGVTYQDLPLVASTTTDPIDITNMTLVGVEMPDLNSTSMTLLGATILSGTYKPVIDGLGAFGSAGSSITFTLPANSTGVYPIPPSLSASFRYIKLVFGSAETNTVRAVLRSIP